MSNRVLGVVGCTVFFAVLWISSSARAAEWENIFPAVTDITACALLDDGPRILLVGTSRGEIYRCIDAADRICRKVAVLKGDQPVRALFSCQDAFYCATAQELFLSPDKGMHWKRSANLVLPGTVLSMACTQTPKFSLYVLTESGLYRCDDRTGSWEKVFALSSCAEQAVQLQEDEQEPEERLPVTGPVSFAVSDSDSAHLWLSRTNRIMESRDGGKTWTHLDFSGFCGPGISAIAAGADRLRFAANPKQLFRLENGVWHEIDKLPEMGQIRQILFDGRSEIYAACSRGLYRASADKLRPTAYEKSSIAGNDRKEPTVRQLQLAAIAYAEADGRKIKDWRKKTAGRAWLPQLSFGVNQDSGDLWHWEGGSTTKECDDILRKGKRSTDWDVSLKWDLADLVWSPEQLSIDVRSRLLVQLRQDVVDEVTRLYFERLRLIGELDELEIAETRKYAQKKLRINEITALLDGLTDGYFSSGEGT